MNVLQFPKWPIFIVAGPASKLRRISNAPVLLGSLRLDAGLFRKMRRDIYTEQGEYIVITLSPPRKFTLPGVKIDSTTEAGEGREMHHGAGAYK